MNAEKREQIKALAETWAESALAWAITLQKPWSAVVTIGVPLVAFIGGCIAGRP